MSSLRQAPLIGRRALVAVVALAIVGGLVVVFSGSLTRSTDIGAQAEQARVEVAARELELAAGEAEQEFFQTDEFIRWQARTLGFGQKSQGETLFALPEDAPTPAPIRPIGPLDEDAPMAPFDAWMELLFGA
jgi:type II secretory pathway pseudopilin PulG